FIYRKIINKENTEKLQVDLNRLGEWAFENEMIINPAKSKAVCFTRARATDLLTYSLRDIVIPEASSCKYLGIAAKFAHHRNDSNWETLTRRREIARVCALFKAYTGEWAWEAIGDRLERPCYLRRVDHEREIRSRELKTDIGKYSF
ncbi:hypothetical protein B7P43_G03175, partial [Cryptotermes secundus]